MRNHRELRAFELADEIVLAIYAGTKAFPKEEQFGLTAQLRKSAASVASNIVEGCARSTQQEYVRFIDIAFGSAAELAYQISVAARLEYCQSEVAASELARQADELVRGARRPSSIAAISLLKPRIAHSPALGSRSTSSGCNLPAPAYVLYL